MSDISNTSPAPSPQPSEHPEELLAAYVEGMPASDQRAQVEGHLRECSRCSADVEAASSARAAMTSLPELEAPGVAAATLAAYRRDSIETTEPASRASASRRRRRFPVGWKINPRVVTGVAGLAAAAAITAVFVFGGSAGNVPSTAPGKAAAASASPAAGLRETQTDYSAQSLTALAAQLSARLKPGSTPADSQAPRPPAAFGPVPGTAERLALGAPFTDAVGCLERGSGMASPTARPTYVEAATFQGTPAYIGAFVVQGSGSSAGHLVLVAVTRDGCQPLFFSTHSL
jgi:hypothetical protein